MHAAYLGLAVSLALAAPAAAEELTGEGVTADDGSPKPTKTSKRKKRDRAPDFQLGEWDGIVEAKGRAEGGALSGRKTLRTSGALIGTAAEITPGIRRGRWRVEAPISLGHRETPGTELRETRGGVDVAPQWRRGPGLRVELETGIRAVWRPGWLDQYQPGPGALMTTDRYSHLDLRAGVGVAGIPRRHNHARLAARYEYVDHRDDFNFDPIDAPTHLVPGDHDQLSLDGSWRYLGKSWKVGGSLELDYERWFQAYARDAGTGRTHAGAGGPPPNPRYRELMIEPAIAGELSFGDGAVEIGASYGYQVVVDRYQGYYSSAAHHPDVELRWRSDKLALKLGVDALWRTYGANSYRAGGSHPSLERGDTRRNDHKLKGELGARWAGGKRWALTGEARLVTRTTNFPDYQPGLFPASRQYAIAWDYTNWEITAGLELQR